MPAYMLGTQRIKRFIVELILAIDYLHAKNIIHRDLKPSNLVLKGKDYNINVIDFGVAACHQAATMVEDAGTLLYQAPEVLEHQEYDGRADVWSLGCVIYAMCTKSTPFLAQTEQSLMEKILK